MEGGKGSLVNKREVKKERTGRRMKEGKNEMGRKEWRPILVCHHLFSCTARVHISLRHHYCDCTSHHRTQLTFLLLNAEFLWPIRILTKLEELWLPGEKVGMLGCTAGEGEGGVGGHQQGDYQQVHLPCHIYFQVQNRGVHWLLECLRLLVLTCPQVKMGSHWT